jgi:hypothetical protein
MRLLAALLLCVIGLSGSTAQLRVAEALPHDVYIWQRVWTPGLIAAAERSSDVVRAWRILLAEADRSGRWTAIAIPWANIIATRRPIIAVIRIDGRLDEAHVPGMLDQIVARVGAVPVALAGVEIDYDCPTSKLPFYAHFVAALRQRLPPSIALSITALPTWMTSAALEPMTRELSEIVLQVHAVDDPRRGLFDAAQAERWVRAFAGRVQRPFRVALPAYDVRVAWRADGRLASVEGEVPLLQGPADTVLLGAAPELVRQFLHSLQHSAPKELIGIAWFRLPTDADARAWSPETWRAVVTDHLPPARLRAELLATDSPELWSVAVSNDGTVDAALPRLVRLDPSCVMADGANGFRLATDDSRFDGKLSLESTGGGRLRPQSRRIIGWARCLQPGRELDVKS